MLFAYIDESGDPSGDPGQGGSPAYALGVILVRATQWADTFDALVNLRRELRQSFGLPVRAEVKASNLIYNEGEFASLRLSSKQRKYIYRRHFRALEAADARAFAVWIDKRSLADKGKLESARKMAWDYLFQRLSTIHDRDVPGSKTPVMIVHDQGEDLTIRTQARRARRHLTAGSAFGGTPLTLSARWLIDDPVPRQSHHSLLVQCADLVAYAATKRLTPGGRRQTRVCPPATWEELGAACYAAVNRLAALGKPDVPPGIVIGG